MKKAIHAQTWQRVTGPDLDKNNKKRCERNKAVLNDEVFLKAVENANKIKGMKCEATKRQSSKWNSGKGAAYKFGRQ